jgi:RNA polymerase primary sigma factor
MNHIPNPIFNKPDAEQKVFAVTVRRISAQWYIPFLTGGLAFIQDHNQIMKRAKFRERMTGTKGKRYNFIVKAKPVSDGEPDPPWSAEEERTIFLQWNYCRLRAATGDTPWAERARAYEEQIVEANLGLVCSMVTKHVAVDGDRDDAISEGQAALMRAMDKFDVRRGYKFSTYACAAINRALIRRYQKGAKRIKRFGCPHDERMDRPGAQEESMDEALAHLSVAIGKADLTPQEVEVLQMRYLDVPPLTLIQIGERLTKADGSRGVTKEWVRQIEERALKKLRKQYEEG